MIVPYVHFDCDPTAGAKDVPKKPDGKSCPVSCLVPCPDWSTQRSSRNIIAGQQQKEDTVG